MRPSVLVPVCAVLCATPALASPCSDRIDALTGRVDAESREAIAASTGGKGAAARREGEGITGTAGSGAPGASPEKAPQAPPDKAAQAGTGADAAQQARVALNEARNADAKGDAQGCAAAVQRAEDQLKRAP